MKKIQLTQDKFAIVDDEDFEHLNKWNWHFNNGYAVRTQRKKQIRMHRVINKTPEGLLTDHIDMDKLNNRKENLRSCTRAENNRHVENRKNTSSKFKGVCWYKASKKWCAYIKKDGKRKQLGYFKSEIEAAFAYNEAAIIHHGEFAKLNEVSV